MKKKLLIGLLALAVLAAGGLGLRQWRRQRAEHPAVIATGEVGYHDIRLTVQGWGTLAAGQVREVTSLTEGLVDKVLVTEGQSVQAGDPLLSLYNATLGMEVQRASLELQQARLELAKTLGVTPEMVDNADPDLALSVRAPVGGRVVELTTREGDQIGSQQDLLRLVDDSQLLVELFLDDGRAARVKTGQPAQLMFHDFSGITSGVVKEVDPNRYPEGSAFSRRIIIAVPNPGLLEPEMKAGVNIDTGGAVVAGTGTATKWVEDTWVVSGVSGRIEELSVQEGSRVQAGQVLARLERSSALLDVYGQILALQQAQVAYERKQEELTSLTLVAPIDGELIAVNIEDGQKIEAGRTVARIANYEQMNTEITIDEVDIVHIVPDMEAEVTVDALPGRVFTAQVTEVAREASGPAEYNPYDSYQGSGGFGVRVVVAEPDDLRAGMTANVSIFIAERLNVLAVPLEAIYERDGASYVQVLDGDLPQEVEVELGLQDQALAEVISGLSEGQSVVTGSSADENFFFDGMGPKAVRMRG